VKEINVRIEVTLYQVSPSRRLSLSLRRWYLLVLSISIILKSEIAPFVSDFTNLDYTLTSRNTVRYLLSSGLLPRAPQSQSMLSLIEKNKSYTQNVVDSSITLWGGADSES
jgi:hypothetical protein